MCRSQGFFFHTLYWCFCYSKYSLLPDVYRRTPYRQVSLSFPLVQIVMCHTPNEGEKKTAAKSSGEGLLAFDRLSLYNSDSKCFCSLDSQQLFQEGKNDVRHSISLLVPLQEASKASIFHPTALSFHLSFIARWDKKESKKLMSLFHLSFLISTAFFIFIIHLTLFSPHPFSRDRPMPLCHVFVLSLDPFLLAPTHKNMWLTMQEFLKKTEGGLKMYFSHRMPLRACRVR